MGVHSNIVEWDNPVAVNPQEPIANLSHTRDLWYCKGIIKEKLISLSPLLKIEVCILHFMDKIDNAHQVQAQMIFLRQTMCMLTCPRHVKFALL